MFLCSIARIEDLLKYKYYSRHEVPGNIKILWKIPAAKKNQDVRSKYRIKNGPMHLVTISNVCLNKLIHAENALKMVG